jgi:hypothetical protein
VLSDCSIGPDRLTGSSPIAKAWPERMRTTRNVLQQSLMESCECWRDCCPTYCIVFADFRAPLSLLDSCSLLLRPESWCGRPLISLLGCPWAYYPQWHMIWLSKYFETTTSVEWFLPNSSELGGFLRNRIST